MRLARFLARFLARSLAHARALAVDVSPRTARTDAPRARAMQFPFRFDGASLRCTAHSFFKIVGRETPSK